MDLLNSNLTIFAKSKRGKADYKKALLAEVIKLIRELSGVKQVEIANTLGITKSAYNQFESIRATLSIKNIYAICELLGINHEWLTGDSDILLYSRDVLFFVVKNKQQLHKLIPLLKHCSYLHIIIPDDVNPAL